MTYDHSNTGTREDLLRARSEGRSLMARRRVTILYRFSTLEDLYARTQRNALSESVARVVQKLFNNLIFWGKGEEQRFCTN